MSYRRILQALLACTLCLGFGTAGTEALTITDGSTEALTITGGSFIFSPTLGTGGASGDNFSISFLDQAGFRGGQVVFANRNSCCLGQIIVGADTCRFGFSPSEECGFLTLTSSIPPNPVPGEPFTIDPIPFTAAGHLNVGPGFDVFGQGSVTGRYCSVPTDCLGFAFPPDRLTYSFSVPEPPSLLLLAGALLAIAGMIPIVRRRQIGSGRPALGTFRQVASLQ
jgi:hypothetical protein